MQSVSPNGETHQQIDQFLIDKRRSSVDIFRSFRGPNFDTEYHLVVAKLETVNK
jgi:hypothetical protein